MDTPEDRPAQKTPTVADNRRVRLVVSGMVAAAVVGGVAYAVYAKRPEAIAATPEAVDRVATQFVQGHSKMQAYGPGWSQHRLIQIASYVRRSVQAA